jgi:hypothetical protein
MDSSYTTSDPAQGQAEWEGTMSGNDILINPSANITPGTVEVWPVAIGNRNFDMGLVRIDYLLQGQNTPSQPREPDRVVVNYMAGYPRDPFGKMDPSMAKIVAHLATSYLPVDKCGCERSSRIIHWWRSFPQDGMNTRNLSPLELDNPFGQSMGALWAWHRVKELKSFLGVVI